MRFLFVRQAMASCCFGLNKGRAFLTRASIRDVEECRRGAETPPYNSFKLHRRAQAHPPYSKPRTSAAKHLRNLCNLRINTTPRVL
ncbi:MAG: hypothetical protein GTO55_01605 [Armatimonadetes bacterium]|nr:hypothetical protein [Armatimonadota bacterium]NIM22973.1 hypothetical protein [Armatimonadota bacterium]NIM66844.1 hypothetical protein [Armatimonadota bacterium]NIO96081.1 hypothetical protein [Armatimonadota bacterium]